MTDVVQLSGIRKSFGGIHALKGVDFALRSGEVHALLGENGAGKSTLMRVLGGEHLPSEGEIRIDGAPTVFHRPADAMQRGIVVIHQEMALAPDLSVAENIFLAELPGLISWPEMKRRARDIIQRLGFDIQPQAIVRDLSVAHQQVVEIAKALSKNARVIVFDEPTAVLSVQDAERLLAIIRDLREQGVGVVYISHRLDEVFRVADRMTIMKDGTTVGTVEKSAVTIDDVISMMVGRRLDALFGEDVPREIGAELLRTEGLGRVGAVQDVSLTVRAGEIVGLGGLVGAGRTELVRLIFGADRRDAGRILVEGQEVRIRRPGDAVRAGIGLVPESRKDQGVVLDMPIRVNATMARLAPLTNAFGIVRRRAERQTVDALSGKLRIKAASQEAPVSSLSGGNQQKVVLAKWFHARGRVLIFDEPTRGVDVGAKTEIYSLIREFAAEGKAVLVVSSEHHELFGLCDRILVMREGRLAGELLPPDYSEEKLLKLAMTSNAHAA
ncbi:sugar ABC transporter ATP-binding protein [Paracoccus sp. APAP_BH8]|uniref:sugar ABC transporter ATP-binding protein n=1 Tax=Paracoccus sp. APAP_BH8 TaxID=3110237 RepID=UPI002FD85059